MSKKPAPEPAPDVNRNPDRPDHDLPGDRPDRPDRPGDDHPHPAPPIAEPPPAPVPRV
jgi:hypothetical protein